MGRKAEDFEEIVRLANDGDVSAQLAAGWSLVRGQNNKERIREGCRLLSLARDAGSNQAAFRLAYIKEVRNDVDCVNDFVALGRRGYSPAFYELGNIYWSGKMVKSNRRKAAVYWRKGGRLGHLLCQARMAIIPTNKPFIRSPMLLRYMSCYSILIIILLRIFVLKILRPFDERLLGRV